ncbi:hypothetical protein [Teredinibacter franksiae]|uniref:hypothetical protein n=1 Tax=Teredinibacter franksiae TaxID=2761453 RepID=UPI001624D5D5|nr:hypothetical protein [Teredinibacter franksiae]
MLHLFKKPVVVDPTTAKNLQLTFQWALDNFDNPYFSSATVLVQPTREYFPDRADNETDMARALCTRILRYSGLSHWPFKVVLPQAFSPEMPPLLRLNTQLRQPTNSSTPLKTSGISSTTVTSTDILEPTLDISYASAMMKQPMDLVGSMSKSITQHFLYQSQLELPNGPESFDATAEILSIFMGFGIMIANTAYTFRGGCGRCYDPRANRTAALSEDEAIYCLALFCHHKQIANKQVTASLKGYLRGRFRKARKQVAALV